MLRWGPTPAAGYAISALRTPDRAGDPRRARHGHLRASSTRETNALAHGLRELGVRRGRLDRDLLPRPPRLRRRPRSRPSKLGATLLLLNTSFAGRQIAEVCATENPRVLIYDEEFSELCAAGRGGPHERDRLAGLADARRTRRSTS